MIMKRTDRHSLIYLHVFSPLNKIDFVTPSVCMYVCNVCTYVMYVI
jgi:hypothetical protein